MTAATIVILAFLLFSLGLTWHHRHTTLRQMVLNDSNTNVPLLAATLVAAYVGGGLTVAIIHFGYTGGMIGVVIGISYSLAFLFLGGLAGLIRQLSDQHNIISFVDFVRLKYDHHCAAVVRFLYLIVFIVFLSAQFVAFSSVLSALYDYPFTLILIVGAAIIIVYTSISGLRGVFVTDVAQVAILAFILFVLILPRTLAGGFGKFLELPSAHLHGLALGPTFAIGSLLFAGLSLFVRIDAWQRIVAARDTRSARAAFVWAGFLILPFFVGYTLIGMDGFLISNTLRDESEIIKTIFTHYFSNTWALAFVALGFVAAIVSSADSLLNVLAVNMVRDSPTHKVMWDRLADSQWSDVIASNALIRSIRLYTVGIGTLSLVLALLIPDLIVLVVGATSGLLVFLPITLGGLVLSRPQPKAGLVSVLTGIVILLTLVWWMPTTAFLPALIASAIAYVFFARHKC